MDLWKSDHISTCKCGHWGSEPLSRPPKGTWLAGKQHPGASDPRPCPALRCGEQAGPKTREGQGSILPPPPPRPARSHRPRSPALQRWVPSDQPLPPACAPVPRAKLPPGCRLRSQPVGGGARPPSAHASAAQAPASWLGSAPGPSAARRGSWSPAPGCQGHGWTAGAPLGLHFSTVKQEAGPHSPPLDAARVSAARAPRAFSPGSATQALGGHARSPAHTSRPSWQVRSQLGSLKAGP